MVSVPLRGLLYSNLYQNVRKLAEDSFRPLTGSSLFKSEKQKEGTRKKSFRPLTGSSLFKWDLNDFSDWCGGVSVPLRGLLYSNRMNLEQALCGNWFPSPYGVFFIQIVQRKYL